MPLSAGSEYDQAVLDLIEHRPGGSVPGTQSNQDALRRLRDTYQIYLSGDHKDGYVTARSLGAAPCFHASNLRDVMEGRSPPSAIEPNAVIFDRYVQSLPVDRREAAEAFRVGVAGRPVHHRAKLVGDAKVIVAHDPFRTLFLVPGGGIHPGLPGNYLYGAVLESSSRIWSVEVHDSADGLVLCGAPSLPAALAKLFEVVGSTPFHLVELETLGFRPD
jgi:hypothetical protein